MEKRDPVNNWDPYTWYTDKQIYVMIRDYSSGVTDTELIKQIKKLKNNSTFAKNLNNDKAFLKLKGIEFIKKLAEDTTITDAEINDLLKGGGSRFKHGVFVNGVFRRVSPKRRRRPKTAKLTLKPRLKTKRQSNRNKGTKKKQHKRK